MPVAGWYWDMRVGMDAEPNERRQRTTRERVSIRDVAKRAGVAMSSVSRVLNGHPNVTPSLRKQVEEAVSALGYQVNLIGSDLRRGTTRTVGVLIDDIANPLFAEIMLGAEAALSEAGYLLTLMSSHGAASGDAAAINHFVNRRVDGLLLALSDDRQAAWPAAFGNRPSDCPVVMLDREAPVACHSVLTDHRQGMDAAIDELVAAGHRRIGLLAGSMRTRPGRERVRAFRSGLQRHGLPVDDGQIALPEAALPATAQSAMDGMLRRRVDARPSAVIVGGSQLLVGALRALQQAGCSVPQDMSIIVSDDTPLAELHGPPMTALSRDVVGIGRAGARLLLEAMMDPAASPRTVTIPVELVRRQSVARIPAV